MARGRRSDGTRNRAAIVDSATTLLAESPEASLAEVARAAGVTRATLYRHFASRDALLDEVLMLDAAKVAAEVFSAIDDLPLPQALTLLADQVVELAITHERIVAATRPRIQELARADSTLGLMRTFVARRREAGDVVSEASDEWLAVCVMVLCLEVVLEGGPPPQRATELAATLRAVIR